MSDDSTKPAKTGYYRYGHGSKRGYELLRLFLRITMFPLGKLRVEGLEHVPTEGPALLTANHVHWTDIPFISMRVPRITHYMAKIELFSVPILGWIMTSLGSYPVRRGERDREALKLSERLLREGELVTIFPEGHRSGSGQLGPGHPGIALIALHSGVPIIPVAIYGTQRVLRASWRYGPFRPRVVVRYGKPYIVRPRNPKRVTREDLERVTDLVMYNIAALLPPEVRGQYALSIPRIAALIGDGTPTSLEYHDDSDAAPISTDGEQHEGSSDI